MKLIAVNECRAGRGVFVECQGRALAVFALPGAGGGEDPDRDGTGRYAVIDDRCPHAGGSLSGGTVEGHIVSCPWHQWEFDLTTGACVHSNLARVRIYPCEVRDGFVYAGLAEGTVSPNECRPPGE